MVFALPPGMAQALELVHRGSTFRVLGGSRQRASRWTPEYVKLLLSPRHSRGITLVYLLGGTKLMRVFSASIPVLAGLLLATAVPALADNIRRVDVGPRGGQLGPGADGCSISANGRLVAFVSRAHVLVPGDTNHAYDVFVRDLATGRVERASVGPGGA